MEPEKQEISLLHYIEDIADALLGKIEVNSNDFLQDLSPEIKATISTFLLPYQKAHSLKDINQTLTSLAKVNKALYALINNPDFCLKLIKHFAQKFNCSDEVAAQALHTQEAQNRLHVQKLFEILFAEEQFDEEEFDNHFEKYANYIDLNFTYKFNENSDNKIVLLLIAAKDITKNNQNSAKKIKWLLSKPNINVNAQDHFGITILMKCALFAPSKTVTLLCNYPKINVNQKNNGGETALMIMCHYSTTPAFNIENMKILIAAGADPEITNTHGLTLLQAVENKGNQDAIDLIKQAIAKKHSQK